MSLICGRSTLAGLTCCQMRLAVAGRSQYSGISMNRRSFVWHGFCSAALSVARPSRAQAFAPTASASLSDAAVAAFARTLSGKVYRSGDPRYEQLRKVYAAKVDQHPALVVHAADAADVSAAVAFADKNKLPFAVRCGGHSYAGYSTCEEGLLLDMSGFRDLTFGLNNDSTRFGGGMLSGAVETATAKLGRAAVLGQCPSVGVGGYLLGGGVSPLMSKYGLGCDNVLAADLVLANGQQATASAHQNQDLYWAIRGGGGNFGVVTAFEVALHPVSEVFSGHVLLRSSDASELMRALRDFAPSAPDELTLIADMDADTDRKLNLSIQACYLGERAAAERVLLPLRRHKTVVRDTLKSMRYLDLEQQVPLLIPPSYTENRGGFCSDLDDRIIGVLADAAANAPGTFEYTFVHLHGAPTRVPLNATAFPLRSVGFAYGITAEWAPAVGPHKATAWVEALSEKLKADAHGNYVNVMDREDESSVRRAYGTNYTRLCELKERYDPKNLFASNQNIVPVRGR
jgi:FAD/FMN-containing dehydrogenase